MGRVAVDFSKKTSPWGPAAFAHRAVGTYDYDDSATGELDLDMQENSAYLDICHK